MRLTIIGLLPLFFLFSPSVTAAPLPPQFIQALHQADISLQHVGLIIWPLNAPAPTVELNPDKVFNPASTLKLVTSDVALNVLGPAYTWQTAVLNDGTNQNGVLNGNLYLRGNGDPSLTDERLFLLVHQLRLSGLNRINGDLIIDQSQFETAPFDTAFDDHPWRAYNALPAATLYDYSATTISLRITNQQVLLSAEPLPPHTPLINQITANNLPCDPSWRDQLHTDWQAGKLTLSGTYSSQCGIKQFALTDNAPSALLAGAFLADWSEQGGQFQGGWHQGTTPSNAQTLFEFPSLPLANVLYNMNKYSNNIMARNVFLSLASSQPATMASANQTVLRWLSSQGLNFPELVMDNGAGLSRTARISAQSMARLLRHAATSPLYPELASSLPIWGEDGTLKKRPHTCAVTNNSHLKTGTLDGVKTLAGYIHRPDGTTVVVVLFINDEHASQGTDAQEALLNWVDLARTSSVSHHDPSGYFAPPPYK
jgi:D-alanyl-D-alanine carboxypeptidase/D-alanyl-D-alanine-endopeptidase (penicillin-binding protein 4)